MKKYKVVLLVEYESGIFVPTVTAESQEEAERIAKNKLISSYPIFQNRVIKIYDTREILVD